MPQQHDAVVDGSMERRSFTVQELRSGGEGKERTIEGYAAVFNEETDVLWWRERIAPGAFSTAISGDDDVRALWNHDSNIVLGRNKAGTLELFEDAKGLRVVIRPDLESQEIRDKFRQIERGDVSQMSFGFRVRKEEVDSDQEPELRTLTDVELFDVSPVTYPAYPTTTVEARDRMSAAKAARAQPEETEQGMSVDLALRKVAIAEAECEC